MAKQRTKNKGSSLLTARHKVHTHVQYEASTWFDSFWFSVSARVSLCTPADRAPEPTPHRRLPLTSQAGLPRVPLWLSPTKPTGLGLSARSSRLHKTARCSLPLPSLMVPGAGNLLVTFAFHLESKSLFARKFHHFSELHFVCERQWDRKKKRGWREKNKD